MTEISRQVDELRQSVRQLAFAVEGQDVHLWRLLRLAGATLEAAWATALAAEGPTDD